MPDVTPGAAIPRDHPLPSVLRLRLRPETLMVACALYLALTQNVSFWSQVLRALPLPRGMGEYALMGSLFVALVTLLLLVMTLFSARFVLKPAAMTLLILASVCSHFLDTYGVVIDESMIVNLVQTDVREASELVGAGFLLHVLLFGVLPAFVVARVDVIYTGFWRGVGRRAALLFGILALFLVTTLGNYKNVSLWVRAHRDVRLYVNPTYPLYSTVRLVRDAAASKRHREVTPIATDARRFPAASGKPRAVVMVVGETARAANFQLNGYARATTPELAARSDILAFRDVTSCGTATAISVPCMFSRLGRSGFSRNRASREENLLDVLARTGVSVTWRDNNSDCKGVCARVASQDFRHHASERLCDAQSCYDEVLLDGLDDWLTQPGGDRFIVLHLMGSHGPSYFRRYPPAFRRFTPDCARDDVQTCSRETIVNAYDNTIAYTDHVLALAIGILEKHRDVVEPSLLYLSDHGESLGENGIYLHGMPYALAPDEQKRVPFVAWAPALDPACGRAREDQPWSQDNLFHTVLGLFDVRTQAYDPAADVLRRCS